MGIRRGAAGFKPGDMKPHGGATIEAGWLVCAGQAVSRATYAALFLAIGTTHGAGDGATTFNLPDLRGRSLFGKDDMGGVAANRLTIGGGGVNGGTLGAVGGGESVTLTSATMPSHTHIQNSHTHGFQATIGNNRTGSSVGSGTGNDGAGTTGGATPTNNSTGSGGAHVNVPPALVANYIIKT